MIKVRSNHTKLYLEEHNIYPKFERYGVAYYKTTSQLLSLLDRYEVEFYCIPNKKFF